MKLIKLVILILFLFLPVSLAQVTIDSFSNSRYNYGEVVLISGNYEATEALRGFLELNLDCGQTNMQVGSTLVDLEKSQGAPFSKLVMVPNTLNGVCSIVTKVVDMNGAQIETAEFPGFEVTSELKATFETSSPKLQLGSTFDIKAVVTKLNNAPVNGVSTIYFRQGEKLVFFDSIEIKNGDLIYSKDLTLIPNGFYNIDFEVRDAFGNYKTFTNIATLELSNKLNLDIRSDKSSYLPGETIVFRGSTSGELTLDLQNLELAYIVDNETKKTQILMSSTEPFIVNHLLQTNIKSGAHQVSFFIKDKEGNYGGQDISFSVTPVPTILSTNIEKNGYIPGDTVTFNVVLKDQAGDLMSGTAEIKLLNGDKVILNKLVATNTQDNFVVPFLIPSTYSLQVTGMSLTNNLNFLVMEHKDLDITLEGQILNIKNKGNVPFKENLNLSFGEKQVSIKLNLGLDKETKLDLGRYFETGTFDVQIPLTEQTFEAVHVEEIKNPLKRFVGSVGNSFGSLTGNAVENTKNPGRMYALVGIFLLGLIGVGLLFRRGKIKKQEQQHWKDYREGKKRMDSLKKDDADTPRSSSGSKMNFGKATQEDIDDFKRRIQRSFAEEEREKTRKQFINSQGQNKDSSPFSMF